MKKNNQDTSLFNTDIARNKDFEVDKIKTTNVNILLNRVRVNKKKEFQKKILFTAATSLGAVLFGVLIF